MPNERLSFFIDETIDQRILSLLEKKGVNIKGPRDFGMPGAGDDVVRLAKAVELKSVLVTADRSFLYLNAEWLGQGSHHCGIILVSASSRYTAESLADKLLRLSESRPPWLMSDLLLPV